MFYSYKHKENDNATNSSSDNFVVGRINDLLKVGITLSKSSTLECL